MRSYTALLLLSFLWSCEPKPSPMADYLQQVHQVKNPLQYQILVFLPQNSCSSCLSKIIAFLNEQKTVPNNTGIIISGYGKPEIIAIRNVLKKREKDYLEDIKYQYMEHNLFDASTAFWMEQKKDGSLQTYILDSPRLAVNLFLLRKAMEESV